MTGIDLVLLILYLPTGLLLAFITKWVRNRFYSDYAAINDEVALTIVWAWPFAGMVLIIIVSFSLSLQILRKIGFKKNESG